MTDQSEVELTSPITRFGRREIALHVAACLEKNKTSMQEEFQQPGRINSCYVDNVLSEEIALEIYRNFPEKGRMRFNNTIRERKYVSAQMNNHNQILEEAVYAFQEPEIVELISEITGLKKIIPDTNLYAGGISAMPKGAYLRPHLDNSHDKDRAQYRVLNLLYYVTPEWRQEYGGNFELWDRGPKGEPREIHSAFNRLVVMITNSISWHSVNPVLYDGTRCCVSNYYFSSEPAEDHEYFHVTSFRGRPGEFITDTVLATDGTLRMAIRRVFKKGIRENPHVYKKPTSTK